ncbi:uncharacterized protein LOC142332277 isoform X2 [Lycorma delicatula]|uniref:uncharacterized protein LOC142332277 isoform X2 n=1 Tax=Lycorma delicatula TaxID=130591 RepID=UPI003F5188C1
MWNCLSRKRSFNKELFMYSTGIPEYIKIQNQQIIDGNLIPNIFSEYYGGVEEDSIFLLKDLTSDGFVLADLLVDFDMDHTKLVIDKLSYFHAAGIAIKEKHKQHFNDSFKDLITPIYRNSDYPERRKESNILFKEKLKRILLQNDKLSKYNDKVNKLIEKIDEIIIPQPKEPFSTIIHNDLWANNVFYKHNKSELENKVIPTEVKFIDFEYCTYGSPLRDLSHFIFTSTLPDVQADFYNLSITYYNNLMKYLKLLNCNYTEFTREKFDEELKCFGWTKLKHTLLLILSEEKYKDNITEKMHNIFICFESNGWL